MMTLTNKEFNYVNAPGILDARIIELPYLGKLFSLIVLLPRERHGLARLKLNFNAKHVTSIFKQMNPTKVNLFLPKFKFSENYSIKDLLEEKIGRQLFYTGADFTGMTDQRNLILNEIFHKVIIEVNENGTEASAATSIQMVTRTVEREETVEFKADHPFLYFIHDRRTGMILFIGQVTHLTDYDEDLLDPLDRFKQQTSERDQDESDEGVNDEILDIMKKRRYGFEKLD